MRASPYSGSRQDSCLPHKREIREREREGKKSKTEDPVFYSLIPAVTYLHFCCMLLVTPPTLVPCGRGPHRV